MDDKLLRARFRPETPGWRNEASSIHHDVFFRFFLGGGLPPALEGHRLLRSPLPFSPSRRSGSDSDAFQWDDAPCNASSRCWYNRSRCRHHDFPLLCVTCRGVSYLLRAMMLKGHRPTTAYARLWVGMLHCPGRGSQTVVLNLLAPRAYLFFFFFVSNMQNTGWGFTQHVYRWRTRQAARTGVNCSTHRTPTPRMNIVPPRSLVSGPSRVERSKIACLLTRWQRTISPSRRLFVFPMWRKTGRSRRYILSPLSQDC